jgi:hypothetical protein
VSEKLVKLYAALGAQVRQGDIIVEVDPSKPGVNYMTSPAISVTAVSTTGDLEIIARIPVFLLKPHRLLGQR